MTITNAQNILGHPGGIETRTMMGPHPEEIGGRSRAQFSKLKVRYPWESQDDPDAWLVNQVPGLETVATAIAAEDSAGGATMKPTVNLAELKVSMRAPDGTDVFDAKRAIPSNLTIHVDKDGGGHADMTLILPLDDDQRARMAALEKANCRWDFGPTQTDVESGDKRPQRTVRNNPPTVDDPNAEA